MHINTEIKAEIKNIKKILVDDDSFYQIPDYQRPYSWDKDQLDELIEDLVSSYQEKTDETYFCGSLVLVNNPADNRFDIIDGQQRITTFSILACVIRDQYKENLESKAKKFINNSIQDEFVDHKRKLKFLTSDEYQLDFEETVLKGIIFEETKQVEKRHPHNRYLLNANYLRDLVNDKVKEYNIDINNFVVWLYEKIVLTVITCPNQDSAIQIFNVLNDRGMPLSSVDILKASLMQKLNNEDRTAFKATWDKMLTELNTHGFELDSMLNTYLYYKIATNPKSRLDKELLHVFSSEGKTSLEILNDISNFSKSYIDTLNEECKHLYCLRYLRHKIYWTSILVAAKHNHYTNIEELKKYLLAFYYQNWVAGATVARIKQVSFNIIKLVKEQKSINEIVNQMRSNLSYYETTKTFKGELIGENVYGRKWDRAILLLVEYFSTDNSNVNYIKLERTLHLEHILPQKAEGEWLDIFDSEALKKYTNCLANLTLLSLRKNMQAKHNSFKHKRSVYEQRDGVMTSFKITQDVAKDEQWDVESILSRQEALLNIIHKHADIF